MNLGVAGSFYRYAPPLLHHVTVRLYFYSKAIGNTTSFTSFWAPAPYGHCRMAIKSMKVKYNTSKRKQLVFIALKRAYKAHSCINCRASVSYVRNEN